MTSLSVTPVHRSLGYACPRCGGEVAAESHAFTCTRCDAHFPVVLGIPDFRLFPDPWIGLEDDRDKARRLEERSRGASLEAMVDAYWSMTPGTPAAQAARFVQHVMHAHARSREWIEGFAESTTTGASGPWLDVGTGTGDVATVAAERGIPAVGVDIAMRWLVVARRRAELAGVAVDLVCCNAEHLPFANGTFARVVSVGTIEHCADADRVLTESRRVLVPGGELRVRTVNRFSLMAEPHVGVWGVGFVPRSLADRYVRWRGGDGYEHHRPLSSREIRRGLRRAGFRSVRVDAAPMLATERSRLGGLAWAAGVYDQARRLPGSRQALRWTAPLLEAKGVAA